MLPKSDNQLCPLQVEGAGEMENAIEKEGKLCLVPTSAFCCI